MAWTAPMTAVSGNVFTANQYNTYIRNNLLATGVAQVTGACEIITGFATNTVVSRAPTAARVETSEAIATSAYSDLATAGPTVTVETGTHALVFIAARFNAAVTNDFTNMSYAVSGATTIAASDSKAVGQDGVNATGLNRKSRVFMEEGLTAGTNTFTAKYNGANSSSIAERELIVWPL